jgi:tetratricopeptide (TPR) repeat protein
VATTNSSIGDCLLALGRDGEALLCYEKVLMDFKNLKGDNHSLVASAFVNLAEFHLRTNKPGEAKSYCEAALRIYGKQGAGHAPGDVAHGLADIAAILEQLNEKETALFLLQRAFNILDKSPGDILELSFGMNILVCY